MLQAMRSTAKYIWIFIVIAFVGGFLVYESAGLFGNAPITPATAVATVNGEEILYSHWQNAIQQIETQRTQGTGYSLNMDERRQVEDMAFDQLVDEILLQQEIKKRKIQVSADEIIQAVRYSPPSELMQAPELQTDGQFDYEKYLRFLNSPTAKQSGLLIQLEAYYKDQLPKQKLFEQITAGAYPSDAQLWQNYKDQHDSVQVSYVAFHPAAIDTTIAIPASEVKEFYNKHKDRFDRPGVAEIRYLEIPRVVSAADSAAVLSRVQDIRSRIIGGESFAEVAKAESEDSASAVQGGDLGEGTLGRFVAPFEDAAKTLKAGEISQPVLTQFGYHIIKMDSRKGDTLHLRHILIRIQQSEAAAAATDRSADSLARLAAGADSKEKFESAAAALGLKPVQAFVREGEALEENGRLIPSVSAWAFSGQKAGAVSDLFDSEDGYYVAELISITPGGIAPLDKVQREIEDELRAQKQIDQLASKAEELAKAAAATSLEDAAGKFGAKVEESITFNRVSLVPGIGRANAAIGAAFGLPVGTVSKPVKTDDGVFVIRVNSRIEAKQDLFAVEKVILRQQSIPALQRAYIQSFQNNLREAAKIKDQRKKIQKTIAELGS